MDHRVESRPILLIAIAVVAAMAIAASLQAQEVTLRPVVQHLDTTVGVTVKFIPTKGFEVRCTDSKQAVVCKTIEGFKLCLLPAVSGNAFKSIRVISYEPTQDKKAAAAWPQFTSIGSAKKQRIETALAFTFKPIWGKKTQKGLKGFELVSLAAAKPPASDKTVVPASKQGTSVERKRIALDLPKQPTQGTWYGVMLVPAWKQGGKILEGFDAVLVSAPIPSEMRK